MAPLLGAAVDDVEVRPLELEGDVADAELDVVDRAHGRHLGRGPGHEDLVGEVEVGADHVGLLDDVAEVAGDLDDEPRVMPGRIDVESGGVRIRPSLTTKMFSPGPVRDEAVVGQQDPLVVAGALRLGRRQHRVEVDRRSPSRRAG